MTIGNTHGIEGFTLDDAMKRLVEMYGLFTNDMLVSIKTYIPLIILCFAVNYKFYLLV